MPQVTVKQLIEGDLGYCCEYAFFTLYKRTTLIADRLGVSVRVVQLHKAAVREGCVACSSKPNCLGRLLKARAKR